MLWIVNPRIARLEHTRRAFQHELHVRTICCANVTYKKSRRFYLIWPLFYSYIQEVLQKPCACVPFAKLANSETSSQVSCKIVF